MRTVLERFSSLKRAAKDFSNPNALDYREVELHDAAIAYAAAVRKVARTKRDS